MCVGIQVIPTKLKAHCGGSDFWMDLDVVDSRVNEWSRKDEAIDDESFRRGPPTHTGGAM